MNVFSKLTLQSLKKNRTRTAVTVIGIILSASMICAVTTFAQSVRNYALREQIYSVGNWHGRVLGTEYATYETVRDSSDAEGSVYLQELGYALAKGCENEFKPYIYLLGAGDKADSVLPVHITSGSFPSSTSEILLPEHLYTNGGVKYNIGDELTLSLGQRIMGGDVLTQDTPCYIIDNGETVFNGESLETRETRTYTVSGFYKRLNWRIEDTSAPGYTALTLADTEASDSYLYDVYFRMKDPGDIYDFMKENHLGNETNRDLLLYTGSLRFDSLMKMLYGLAAIVTALIIFGSVALIYNAFSISVSERTRQFGLLSSVGATKKQLRRMVLFEAFAVSIIGIPLGIIAGIGGIGITLMFIGNKFHSFGFSSIDMTLSVSPASVLIAAAVALVTVLISARIPSERAAKVSAVEAIRQNADITDKGRIAKTSKLTYRLFGLPGVLASKHYKRDRKKYRTTVMSLFMSIVLFVSASAFTEYLTETVYSGFRSVGYDLLYQASADAFKNISPDMLLERIGYAKSVTGCAYSRLLFGDDTEIGSEYLTESGASFIKKDQARVNVAFADDDTFKDLLKKHGLSEEKFFDREDPRAVALDGINQFNDKTQKYETVKFFNSNESEVILRTKKDIPGYTLYDIDRDSDGNSIYRYIKDGTEYKDGNIIKLTAEEATVSTVLKTGSVLTERPDFIFDVDGIWLIYPISLTNAVFKDYIDENARTYYFTIVSDDHAESEEAVKELLNECGLRSDTLYDYAERAESNRNIVTVIRVFSYGFTVLISLIAAANVFNTISTNISLRRREFAMLKSVGMSQKSFKRMMDFECLLYGSRALLYGLPVACGITWLIYKTVTTGYETTFHLPWPAICIASLSIFLVVFVTMIYATNKIKKDNPIDALKNETL